MKYTIYPVLGEKARNNGKVVYSLDFEVTPHQLRHTYITNLIFASVDPKTVQYQKYNPAHSDTGETSSAASEDNLVCGSLTMNIKAHTCFLGETPLVLTPTEFSILRILLENTGNVVSSEDLFHKIWQDEYYSKSNNTITVHIRHLREKMGDSMDKPRFIKTIWGVGYKIES